MRPDLPGYIFITIPYIVGCFKPGYICIIEDVDMTRLPSKISAAAAVPLCLEGIDSGPVTMWAEIEEQHGN